MSQLLTTALPPPPSWDRRGLPGWSYHSPALFELERCLEKRVHEEFEASAKWEGMFSGHRHGGGEIVRAIAISLGLEAKRLAARAGVRVQAGELIDRFTAAVVAAMDR